MSDPADDMQSVPELVALKRHERPPPGYFQHFSDKVIARIEAEGLAFQAPLWRRILSALDTRPVFACAYCLAVGALLYVGLADSENLETQTIAAPTASNPWLVDTPAVEPPRPAASVQGLALDLIPVEGAAATATSIQPVVNAPPRFLFDASHISVERASFERP